MVSWNSQERGARIGDSPGLLGLYIACEACHHTARIRQAKAVETWGAGARAGDIARRLKCTKCGAKRGNITAISDSRPHGSPRDPDDYWGPSPPWPEL